MTIKVYTQVPYSVLADCLKNFTPWEAAQLWADAYEFGVGENREFYLSTLVLSAKHVGARQSERPSIYVRERVEHMACAIYQG